MISNQINLNLHNNTQRAYEPDRLSQFDYFEHTQNGTQKVIHKPNKLSSFKLCVPDARNYRAYSLLQQKYSMNLKMIQSNARCNDLTTNRTYNHSTFGSGMKVSYHSDQNLEEQKKLDKIFDPALLSCLKSKTSLSLQNNQSIKSEISDVILGNGIFAKPVSRNQDALHQLNFRTEENSIATQSLENRCKELVKSTMISAISNSHQISNLLRSSHFSSPSPQLLSSRESLRRSSSAFSRSSSSALQQNQEVDENKYNSSVLHWQLTGSKTKT